MSATISIIGSSGDLETQSLIESLDLAAQCMDDNTRDANQIRGLKNTQSRIAHQRTTKTSTLTGTIDCEAREHDNRNRVGHVSPDQRALTLSLRDIPRSV